MSQPSAIHLADLLSGHVAKGILIVPGAHASLDNINAAGEWIEDEVFTYMGQTRKHQKGAKAGRVMGAWRKIRESDPHLLKHFSVYSQPASNMDGIIMSWVVKAMSKQHPVALHQRDCFSAAFSPEVMNMQYLAHEVPCSVMAKMTAAMQLTDTDFSHQFKSIIRQQVDECNRKGMEAIRADPAAPSEIYKMSLKDVATCLDHAMQTMIDKNDEDNWVLAGMRRNGFLAVRPDGNGRLTWCGDQSWCKSMPLGSSRIPASWLENRLAHIKKGGAFVPEPIWDRMSGATELQDLIEWSYQHPAHASSDMEINIEAADEVDWVAAGKFQLPLDLRRQLAIRENTLDEKAQEKRQIMKDKRKQRKIRMEARKQITQDERDKITEDLQSKSRYEAMSSITPSAKTLKPSVLKKNQKKQKLKNKHAKITDGKRAKKQQKKSAMRNEALKLLKNQKEGSVTTPTHESMPPLPPPPDAPPSDAPAISEELPKGTFRVVSDEASDQLYGRQGSVISIGNQKYQLLLQKKKAHQKEQLAWVSLAHLHEIDEKLPVWTWPQFSLSRYLKCEILKDAGTITYDVMTIPESWRCCRLQAFFF